MDKLPSGWELIPLALTGKWYSGGTPNTTTPEYWDGDIPWISASSLQQFFISDSERRITELGAENGTRLVPENTILFVVRGMSLRKEFRVGITQRTVAFSQDCKAIIPQDNVDALFLAYSMCAKEAYILNLVDDSSHGTGRLQTSLLEKIEIPLPPLPEQRKIAAILGTWDAAIATVERLIAALEQRKRGLMQRLLTGAVRFPGFTEPWREVRLGDVFSERRETGRTDLPLLSITNSQGVVDRDSLDRRDTSADDKSKYLRICVGDIGYNTMRMWQGVSAVSSLEGIVSPAYTICKPKKSINVDFMGYLFKFPPMVHKFWRYSQGLVSDTLALKYKNFAEISVLIPSADEQQAIATLLQTCDQEIALHQQQRDSLREQKTGLMQRLLTGQVRVAE